MTHFTYKLTFRIDLTYVTRIWNFILHCVLGLKEIFIYLRDNVLAENYKHLKYFYFFYRLIIKLLNLLISYVVCMQFIPYC